MDIDGSVLTYDTASRLIKREVDGVIVDGPRSATEAEFDMFKSLFIDLSAEDKANETAALAAFSTAIDYIQAIQADKAVTRQELTQANRLVKDAFAAFRTFGRTNDSLTYEFMRVLYRAYDATDLYLKNLESGVAAAIDQGITLRADFDGHTHP
jgi:hypothetical protein